MAEIIRMPRLSDTMEEGVIIGWLKKEGDKVQPGDVLAEVETDKATMELESFYDGVLLHIGVAEGTVPVDGILAVIGEEGEDYKAQLEEAKNSTGASSDDSADDSSASDAEQSSDSDKEESTPDEKKTEAPAPASAASSAGSPAMSNDDDRIKASPLARKMAADAGISLSDVNGSGEGGRIIKRDIETYEPSAAPAEQGDGRSVRAFSPGNLGESSHDQPVSQMRKTIARRLGESKFSAPHFYLTVEIDMDASMAQRKAANNYSPVKISFNDFVVKACALALRDHPTVNSSWHGDKITQHDHVHIGVAVAVDDGLLVPVIKHADHKSLSQLNQEVKTLAGKAKNKKLSLEEMQGNTFTISNLGMFGIEEFTAIINPPDACILAVGTIVEKPVVRDGQIVVGHMMKVTMSCDHRVVDGASGAKFLQTLKTILENPMALAV